MMMNVDAMRFYTHAPGHTVSGCAARQKCARTQRGHTREKFASIHYTHYPPL